MTRARFYFLVTFSRHDAVMSISIARSIRLANSQTAPVATRIAPQSSIRRKIMLALLCVGLITAGLGAYAIRGIVAAGTSADEAVDAALASVGYARSASAGFMALEAAAARYRTLPNQSELQPQIKELLRTLDENLADIARRAATPQEVQAAAAANAAIADWRAAGGLAVAGIVDGKRVDVLARLANRRLERLINQAAGKGLEFQQRARAEVSEARLQTLLWTLAAMILGGMIITLLARRIMGLIFSVSAAALRITAGRVDTKLPNVGADELAALLTTIATMRDNIAAMTALELADHQPGKSVKLRERAEAVDARSTMSRAGISF